MEIAIGGLSKSFYDTANNLIMKKRKKEKNLAAISVV